MEELDQRQAEGRRTIQGEVERAIAQVTGQQVTVIGAKAYRAIQPPSTTRLVPVTSAEASLAMSLAETTMMWLSGRKAMAQGLVRLPVKRSVRTDDVPLDVLRIALPLALYFGIMFVLSFAAGKYLGAGYAGLTSFAQLSPDELAKAVAMPIDPALDGRIDAAIEGATGLTGPQFWALREVARDAVERTMTVRIDATRSRFVALWSAEERAFRRIRGQVVPLLARVYPASAAQWKRRGYLRRPGEARPPRDYTEAGTAPQC